MAVASAGPYASLHLSHYKIMYNKRLASKIVADTIRYKLLFYVQSKADMTLLNLPHGTNN